MSCINAIDELINVIQNVKVKVKVKVKVNAKRKGQAQSNTSSIFKWKKIDLTADRELLKTLQKYKVVNSEDIQDAQKSPDIQHILSKYFSLINKHQSKNGNKYKLLVLVRHGEGFHNWAKWEKFGPEEWNKNQSTKPEWKDPSLTQTGIDQVKTLMPTLKCLKSHLDFVITSPLKRALQTSFHAILPWIEININNDTNEIKNNEIIHKYKCPIYVLEYTRERMNHHACDSRNDFKIIKNEWKEYDFKYQGFDSNHDIKWNSKADERRELLWKRVAKMMDFIWETDGNVIIYSGHCDFIMALMEVVVGMPFYKPRNASYFPIIITNK
eukprot:179065_1